MIEVLPDYTPPAPPAPRTGYTERDMSHGGKWGGERVIGWWASEKYDGCRVLWKDGKLWTRSGRTVDAPGWFAAQLPDIALDCELWAGRGTFEIASKAATRGLWHPELRLAVFDAPDAIGIWSQRMAAARAQLQGCPVAFAVEGWRVEGVKHLRRLLANVEAQGGEGLIVRHPSLPKRYVPGRNRARILKLYAGATVYF